MKRLLALLLILALAYPVMATQQMWTNYGDDYNILYTESPTYSSWTRTAGLNNYAYANSQSAWGSYPYAGVMYNFPYQTTYSAITLAYTPGNYFSRIVCRLRDANQNVVQSVGLNNGDSRSNVRYEMKIDGATPRYYANGVLLTSGAAIGQNPFYVEWDSYTTSGTGLGNLVVYWDDYVIAEPSAMQMSLPEGNNETIIILKDIVNPAQSGLAFGENGTIINSNYMTGGRWSRGNATIGADLLQPNESIEFRNLGSGVVYATNYTGTGLYGTMAWNVKTMLIDSGAPQGTYGLYRPKTGEYGDSLMYKSNGASVHWDRDTYSVGDTGVAVYYVLSGGYWDTSKYSYKVSILNQYYQYLQNTTLTESSGSVDYTFTTDDTEGIYHAILTATTQDGYEYLLGSDYAELSAYFGINGYVIDGQHLTPIANSAVNITQGSIVLNQSSDVDGKYATEASLSTGESVFINATATGYRQYTYSFVPLAAKSIALNITLVPDTPDVTGIGIGGIARDVTYGRPIDQANVSVRNVTNGQEYFKLTNIAGWYLCDEGSVCDLVANRLYAVQGKKLSYADSAVYQVVAVGA
jgi:hypothetical protein